MKNLLMFLCIFPFLLYGQSKTFYLEGKVEITSYSQGGAELMPEEYEPHPFEVTLYVVEYIDSLTVPTLLDSFTTDSNGYYQIDLKEGTFGFVLKEDLTNLKAGQFLPKSETIESQYEQYTSIWRADQSLSFKVDQSTDLTLNFHYVSTSVCYLCP